MHHLFHEWSTVLSNPIANLTYSMESVPILFALLLGMVAILAPCQITGNLGAIMLYGNKSLQEKVAWKEAIAFITGKIAVYSILGVIVLVVGKEIMESFQSIAPYIRKLLGPMLVFIGLVLMGLINVKFSFSLTNGSFTKSKKGVYSAFLFGVFISLGFCPTMFLLFFLTLMPIVLTSSVGVLLPSVFAIGTSLPLLTFLILIAFTGFQGKQLKQSKKIGSVVQIVTGLLLFTIGALDTLTFWFT
jgi:cytochrome c-type biogenesis protein